MGQCSICRSPATHHVSLSIRNEVQHPLEAMPFCAEHARRMLDELGSLHRIWVELSFTCDPPISLDFGEGERNEA